MSQSGESTGTSRSLLERVKADDRSAWERLVNLYAPLVYHWCRSRALQEDDIADVFQEVFLAVATHIAAFRKERPGDTFRGWLRTITLSKVADHFRRLGKEPPAIGGSAVARLADRPPADSSGDGSGSGDQQAEHALFRRCLELIKGEFEERTWQAFWRTTIDSRSPKDVGVELGMSPGAVRVAKCRILQRLREELGDLDEV